LASGPSSGKDAETLRILFLDLDTLRPDHLGCYGYHRNTSPNIDRIAAQGVRFTNYYCSDAPCLPSRAALMTGRFGIRTGVVGHGGTAADMRLEGETRDFNSLIARRQWPYLLSRRAGFHTVTISPFAERHSAYWFLGGFREAYDTGGDGGESAEQITPTVLDWIERNAAKDDWFLHVNYWDPHTPYRAPAEFGNPFEHDPLPAWLTEEVVKRHQQAVGPHTAREAMMYDSNPSPRWPRHPGEVRNMRDLRRFMDGYDCGIAYLDSPNGQIFDALEKKGVMDNLAIIITSDHGENLGEFGIYGEHATADQPTCHVPMIVRWPGCKAGRVDEGLHYQLDFAPTLADLLGHPPFPGWDGRSYAASLLRGENCGRDYLVLSQCAHVCQRSVRVEDWLYVRTYHDGYHLFPEEMLFDLAGDPYQQRDRAGARPEVCQRAAALLAKWHTEMMRTMPSDADPLWTVMREGGPAHARGRLKGYCARLEATGRGWAVPELKRRHPREFE
jgi:arylsulfatase A-like enzyme